MLSTASSVRAEDGSKCKSNVHDSCVPCNRTFANWCPLRARAQNTGQA
jgi:hypothetical protein